MTDVKETAERISTERLEEMLARVSPPTEGWSVGLPTMDVHAAITELLTSRHADAQEGGDVEPVAEKTRKYVILRKPEAEASPADPIEAYGVYLNDGRFMDIASSDKEDAISMAEVHYETSDYEIRPLYAAPSNPVVSDEIALRGWIAEMAHGSPLFINRVALALSQAYERGQESMRERAATVAFDAMFDQVDAFQARKLQTEIRSLPIEQEGGE